MNAIAPGFFVSEMTDQFEDDYVGQKILPRLHVKRLDNAEELAAALIFLASDAGGYVTGQTIPVEGGLLVGG